MNTPNKSSFLQLRDLLQADRSVRRFMQEPRVSHDTLCSLVDLTRFCASGRNMQPLRYRLVTSPEECDAIFPLLAWAGYMPDWDGPAPEERPTAYLIQCLDTSFGPHLLCDDGLQLQAITLGATALGIGGCIIKSFNAPALSSILNLPEGMAPRYVLALGAPAEEVTIHPTDGTHDADIKYYRSEDNVHHVPKRPLSELIIK